MAKHDYTDSTLTVAVAIGTYLEADLTEVYNDIATNVSNIAGKVGNTGDEEIAGTKTYTSSPVIPAPTLDLHPATKKYIDDLIAAVNSVPSGLIAQWSGALADIPSGWSLCDGDSGRPDLADKFVKGIATDTTEPGSTGGSKTITEANLPAHDHDEGTLATETTGAHAHGYKKFSNAAAAASGSVYVSKDSSTEDTDSAGDHSHTISGSTGSTGSGTDFLPVFYELAYIIKD